jgi:hypothetical protein
MNELGILAAGAGGEVPLLDEADVERHGGTAGSQGEIANDSGSIDSATQDEHIERRFSKALNLLGARVRHSVTSLEDVAPKKHIAHKSTLKRGPMRDTKDNDRRADSLLLRGWRSFVVGLFLLLFLRGRLALVRCILRENGGRANEQRQTKQYAHQFLHSGLLKCLGNCA